MLIVFEKGESVMTRTDFRSPLTISCPVESTGVEGIMKRGQTEIYTTDNIGRIVQHELESGILSFRGQLLGKKNLPDDESGHNLSHVDLFTCFISFFLWAVFLVLSINA